MSSYAEYFLNSASTVIQFDLLEISHPNFTQVYRVVRNAADGLTVTLENDEEVFFRYYPLGVKPISNSDDLEQRLQVQLGDLGEVLPRELDAVSSANGFKTKPTVIYRTYRSDDLSAPLLGPLYLEVTEFNFTREGSAFEAKAPSLNINRTGEVYKLARFPMLRGFI